MDESLAILTVSYNSSEALKPFLKSLDIAGTGSPRVVIADNKSGDVESTRELAKRFGASLIELPANLGYGGGIMAAYNSLSVKPAHVLVVNPDVTFTPGSIDVLLRASSQIERAGALGPRILEPDGSVYPSARELPTLRTGVGHALFGRVWPTNPWTRKYRPPSEKTRDVTDVGWLSGSCLLIRTEVFESIHGFDPSYFMYFEDVDLGARLSAAGWSNVYVPEATVVHEGGHSTVRQASSMTREHHESAYRYLSRRYAVWYLAPLRFVLWIGLRLRAKWLTRPRRGRV